MSKYEPPFKLDPHVAIRTPDRLPLLMVRAMHSVVRSETQSDPSAEVFIKAFNIAAWTLTTAGRKASNPKPEQKQTKKATVGVGGGKLRKKLVFKGRRSKKVTPKRGARQINWRNEGQEARLIEGTLNPTGDGAKLEQAAKNKPDTDAKVTEVTRWAKRIYAKDQERYNKSWWAANRG